MQLQSKTSSQLKYRIWHLLTCQKKKKGKSEAQKFLIDNSSGKPSKWVILEQFDSHLKFQRISFLASSFPLYILSQILIPSYNCFCTKIKVKEAWKKNTQTAKLNASIHRSQTLWTTQGSFSGDRWKIKMIETSIKPSEPIEYIGVCKNYKTMIIHQTQQGKLICCKAMKCKIAELDTVRKTEKAENHQV